MNRSAFVVAAACMFMLAAAHAQDPSTSSGQAFPSRPIRIISPFAPGGATDALGRTLSTPLGRVLKQNVIVENRPGGSTVIGTESSRAHLPTGIRCSSCRRATR